MKMRLVDKLRPFFIALQFLTRLPVPPMKDIKEKEIGQSILFYPAVGLLIGLMLVLIAWTTGNSNSLLTSALVLSSWVLITGVLHLDGLADSADAWLGGNGDKEKTLEIMKDPRSGPVAVTILILVLLLKFVAIETIVSSEIHLLLFAPVIARAYLPILLLTTPYVRRNGLGSTMVEYLPPANQIYFVALFICIGALLNGFSGFIAISTSLICFLLIRKLMLKRIDGTTGDTAGAMLEMMETTILISVALTI